MSHLLRVALPDVPGSLGRVATAIGLAGGNIEAIEIVEHRADARDVLVDALPLTFRVDWAARLRPEVDRIGIVRRTTAAPESIPDGITWPETVTRGMRLEVPEPWSQVIAAGCPLGHDGDLVVIARRGGPVILDSEIARLSHLCALADSIAGAET